MILYKLHQLGDQERRLEDLLSAPLAPAHSTAARDTHTADYSVDKKSATKSKLVSLVSDPWTTRQEEGRGCAGRLLRGEGRGGRGCESCPGASVRAPAVHETFEAGAGAPLQQGWLSGEQHDQDEGNSRSRSAFLTHEAICGEPAQGGLRLVQCAPGPREELLSYRKQLKR